MVLTERPLCIDAAGSQNSQQEPDHVDDSLRSALPRQQPLSGAQCALAAGSLGSRPARSSISDLGALLGRTRSWSYRQFHAEVRRLAAGLAALGVKPTERVLIHLDNCPESLLAWYACAELGAVGVTTNTRSAGPEVAYFAAHSQAVGAITQPAHADLIAREAKGIRWLAVTDNDAGGICRCSTPMRRPIRCWRRCGRAARRWCMPRFSASRFWPLSLKHAAPGRR
jgi:non-ribosomal peptide synthetase component F